MTSDAPLAVQTVTWRDEARATFAACRSVEAVRDAYARLWRRAEVAEASDLIAICEEFHMALRRFGVRA